MLRTSTVICGVVWLIWSVTDAAWGAAPRIPRPVPKPKAAAPAKVATGTSKAEAARDKQLCVPEAELLVALPNRDDPVVLAPGPARFVAVGDAVYDLQTRQATGKCAGKLKKVNARRALSPDGRFFAYEEDTADYITQVIVLDCQTGERKQTLKYTEEKFKPLNELTFTKHGNLIAVARAGAKAAIFLWKPDDGRLLKQVALDGSPNEGQVAFSASGQLAAVASSDKFRIYDVVKETVAAELQRPSGTGSMFLFVTGIAFSPDSKEVSALIQDQPDGGFRLVIWNVQGSLVDEIPLGLQAAVHSRAGAALLYTPGQDGWLVHGDYLLDRKLKSVVWLMHPPIQHIYPHAFLDADHVLTSRGDFKNRELVSLKLPRAELNTALGLLAAGQNAAFKPGDNLTVTVEVGEARFADKQRVAESLHDLLSKRMAGVGLNLAPESPVTLHAKYSEASGATLHVLQGGPFGRDTGQTVQETVTVLELRLVKKGSSTPIWEKTERKGNPHLLRGKDVSDQAIRDQTFKLVQHMIRTMTLPYFIPADPKAPRLPLITNL